MKLRFWDYVKAAFRYKPPGMFVVPNWVFLGGVAMGAIFDPAYLVLGAGLECAYLYFMANNPRFRRSIDSRIESKFAADWQQKIDSLLSSLSITDQRRYQSLAQRCQNIIEQQSGTSAGTAALQSQSESLSRLLWIYLRLLMTRQGLDRMLTEASESSHPLLRGKVHSLEDRIADLQKQIGDPKLNDELRKSLKGQIEILQQRMAKQAEAREKLQYLEAELTRIQEQVELIREQAAVSSDPEVLSHRIDDIAATLGGTSDWIAQQNQMFGKTEDLLDQPAPLRNMVRVRG